MTWPTDYHEPLHPREPDERYTRPERRTPAELRKLPYRKYLKSPEWRETRRRKANLENYRCQRCGARNEHHLNIHHLNYDRLGCENLDDDLECLCERCHRLSTESCQPANGGKRDRR